LKEEIIYLKNKEAYLSSVLSDIPENAIIYKKITGIGATTLEIKSKRNSIIIEPNTPVIQEKIKKHNNLFGIYEGVQTSQIITYLQDESIPYKKLMTTPESFDKIRKALYMMDIDIYKEYFLLFDECHKLTSEINYRSSITLPMHDFWKFEKRSLISATITNFATYPIFKKYGFRNITIEPTWHHAQNVNLYSSNNILQDINHYLEQTFKNEDDKFCFFINSVDIIASIINALGIQENTNIYCAEKSIEKLRRKSLINIFSQLTELNQYNFYTSRFFSAVDIISDFKPHVVIISDAVKAPQTLIEPLLESRQIAGRFRNGISSFTHIARLNKDIQFYKKTDLEEQLDEQLSAYKQLKIFYDLAKEAGVRQVMKEALERVEISKYLDDDMSFNYFMTENLFDTESAKSKYKTWQDFVLSYSLDEEYFEIDNQYNNQYSEEEPKLKISSNISRQLRKQIVDTFFSFELDKGIYTDEQKALLQDLERQDEFIIEICRNFNKEFIVDKKYNKQQLTLALIKKKSDEKRLSFPVIEAVLKSFKIGIAYTEQEIADKLKLIYEELKIEKTVKATDIQYYFKISYRKTVKRKNKYLKGYKLLKAKFNELKT